MTHLLLPNTMSATTLVFVCALVLKAAPIGLKDLKVSVPMSCVDVDTDGLVDRHQVASIVQHIKALEVASPPILLVLLCRAYLSRRLVLSFRDLPEDIILLPCLGCPTNWTMA
ncbi:unnamed protein product [Durusdinium trenchii]|uniref:Uncharacterized protein n=1 Tax=Durusdinium trenchii TaxID=1381693 RepID=A0ABP0HF06_9DINO